jgi:hypothetical protein
MDAALKAFELQLRESYQSFTGEFIIGGYKFYILAESKLFLGGRDMRYREGKGQNFR